MNGPRETSWGILIPHLSTSAIPRSLPPAIRPGFPPLLVFLQWFRRAAVETLVMSSPAYGLRGIHGNARSGRDDLSPSLCSFYVLEQIIPKPGVVLEIQA